MAVVARNGIRRSLIVVVVHFLLSRGKSVKHPARLAWPVLRRMGLYRANVQTWIIPPLLRLRLRPSPPSPAHSSPHRGQQSTMATTAAAAMTTASLARRRSFSHFSFLLLLSIPTSDRRQKCTTGRATRETSAEKAARVTSILNEHFELRRSIDRPIAETETGEVASQSRHPTVRSVRPPAPCASVGGRHPSFLLSESVRKSLAAAAAAAAAAHKIPSASRRSSPPGGRRPRDNRRRRNLFHRKVVYHN